MHSPLRQFVDAAPEAMMIVGAEGRIRHANAQAASLFGYELDGLRGQPVRRLVPDQPVPLAPGERPRLARQINRRMELVGTRADASKFSAEVEIVPVETESGSVAVVTVRDMTEAQHAQLVLERTLEVLHDSDRERQLLVGQLVRAQEEERKRIAAGIHDDTIQVITAIHLRMQQLRNRLKDPAELEVLGKLEEAIQGSLSRLRKLIFDLRPSTLEDGHFAAALRIYLEEMQSSAGIAYDLDDQIRTDIPLSIAVLMYRTAQEALMNVRKHAQATKVRVRLTDLANGWLVQITDDGVGYDPAEVENSPGHLGLALMRERPQMAGGWCGINSAPGAGTTVEFWVPADPGHIGVVAAA